LTGRSGDPEGGADTGKGPAVRRTAVWGVVVGLLLNLAACGGGEPAPATSEVSSPSAGPPGPGRYELTLDHDGTVREYRLYAPPGYDVTRQLPLVIALHAYPGSGAGMSELAGLDPVADREGFLTAYPDGINGGFNAFVCCGQADDVGFLKALTEHLVREWNVDPDRIYLTGISNGGDLSFRAAVEAPGVFAAIGVVSGGFIGNKPASATYAPTRPVSVITFIGDQDRYAGQFTEGVQAWRQRLRCVEAGPTPNRPARNVTLSRSRCADGSDIDVYTVAGMGHAWPGATTGTNAAPDAGIVATDLLWPFFSAHRRTG
jgi:polyhydroxybutyrate depolymerase